MSALRLLITLDDAALDALANVIEARILDRHARVNWNVLPRGGYPASEIRGQVPVLAEKLAEMLGSDPKPHSVELAKEATGFAADKQDG